MPFKTEAQKACEELDSELSNLISVNTQVILELQHQLAEVTAIKDELLEDLKSCVPYLTSGIAVANNRNKVLATIKRAEEYGE